MVSRLLAVVVLLVGPVLAAHAETPAEACVRIGTDDATRAIPAELAPAVNAAFGMRMPAPVAVATTVFRCMDGHVLVCTAGANLPCGKANTSRTPGAGAVEWCRGHADSGFVPAYVTGHDTIYDWRCRGGVPELAEQALTVDARGFIAQYWRTLP